MKEPKDYKTSEWMQLSNDMMTAWTNIIEVLENDKRSFPLSDKEVKQKLIQAANGIKRSINLIEIDEYSNIGNKVEIIQYKENKLPISPIGYGKNIFVEIDEETGEMKIINEGETNVF